MNKTSYVILVIDDELVGPTSRRSRYEAVFAGDDTFRLEYLENRTDLNTIKSRHADAYLIDMFLENWGGLTASKVMETYISMAPKPAPIFLVSAQWGKDSRVMEELKQVTELGETSRQGSKVKHFFTWDEFAVSSANDISPQVADRTRCKLQTELDYWHGRSYTPIADGDKLRILHISDMQYGDPAFSGDCRLDEDLIATYLMNAGLAPHLLAITGDITYSGCPTEFDKALTGLERLIETVFDCHNSLDSVRERILLVPGNHDINLRFGSCANYKYVSFKDEDKKPVLQSVGAEIDSNAAEKYTNYSWQPFRDFAAKLTRDRRWLDGIGGNLCWVSQRFSHWGLQVVPINTVRELTCLKPSIGSVTESDLRQLTAELRHQPSLFRIALSHHGKDDLGGYKEDSNWQVLAGFFANNNIQLLMHGHTHQSRGDWCTDPCFKERTLNISIAPSLTLNSRARQENATRGFTLIEIERLDGQVTGGEIIPFEIREKNITERSRRKLNVSR